MNKRSFDFKQIVSTKKATTWWSPTVGKMNCPVADLQLLRDALAAGCLHKVERAWQGAMLQACHQVMFRLKAPSTGGASASGDSPCLFAMHHYDDSAVLAWPLKKHDLVLGGGKEQFFEFDVETRSPVLVGIFDHKLVEACTVIARSWLWQWQHFGDARARFDPAVRLFANVGPASLLEVAARSAFWSLSKTWMDTLVQFEDWHLDSSDSVFDTLFGCIQNALKCSDEEALTITSRRLGEHDFDTVFATGLLEVDEAIECLERHDHSKLVAKQNDYISQAADRKAFVSDYTRKKQENIKKGKPVVAKGRKPKLKATLTNILGCITYCWNLAPMLM